MKVEVRLQSLSVPIFGSVGVFMTPLLWQSGEA